MSIALISSLYRSEPHLPTFAAAVFGFAQRLSQRGVEAHYLPIVNDATDAERERIERLASEINSRCYGRMTPHYVARESLYASWNRGLRLTDAAFFAPWNADDIRSSAAFLQGYRALQAGADLVDFPFTSVIRGKRFGRWARERRLDAPCLFQRERFTRKNGLGPFFMASRRLYQRLGLFDDNFQVAGDTEWASRAIPWVKFQPGSISGGDFVVHGGNLSNTGGEREDIEVNVIFLRLGAWAELRPANPEAMRAAWESWGNPARVALPRHVPDYLWGAGAEKRWRRYQRERRQPAPLRRLRLGLAARGWLRSEEWAATGGGRERT